MATVQWLTPFPLWDTFASETAKQRYRRPAILRYDADTFMQDLGTDLAEDPQRLASRLAHSETWLAPAAGVEADSALLKLYQPVHLRFYLVSASLVCRLPGLPDHTVHPESNEKVSFVLRRLDSGQEYAWRSGDAGGWMAASPTELADGEDRVPMFPVGQPNSAPRRRMFAGLVPVSRRQAYVTGASPPAPAAASTAGASTTIAADDPRVVELGQKVIAPWVQLRSWFRDPFTLLTIAGQLDLISAQSSAFILIDTADYLEQYLPSVRAALDNPSLATNLSTNQKALYDKLGLANAGFSNVNLRDAMVKAKSFESQLEAMQLSKGASPAFPTGYPLASGSVYYELTDASFDPLFSSAPAEDGTAEHPVRALFEAALTEEAPKPIPYPMPQQQPDQAGASGLFLIRCVYERPQCGKKSPPVLSDPSRAFAMASFFDPDAPARPLQIALPVDTTPAALRKYPKNAAFLISDELQKQLSRIKSAKKLMDGDVGDPQFGIGFICSLSIPIITIVAFILLMIFVVLLNIVFWWLPFFKICFPVPTIKAKG